MNDVGPVAARRHQGHVQRVRRSLGRQGGAQLPCDEGEGEVVQERRQIEPAPADPLEVAEVGLLKLVRRRGLVPEGIRSLDDHKSRAGDPVVDLEASRRPSSTHLYDASDRWQRRL